MTTPWTHASGSTSIGPGGTLSLVDGSTFVVSALNGDIHPDQPHGLFVRDTRVLSLLVVEVDDLPLTLISPVPQGRYTMSVVTRAHHSLHPEHADPPLTILRHRSVGPGLREDIELHNRSIHPVELRLGIEIAADFASLFDVKADAQHSEANGEVVAEESAALTLAAPHWGPGPRLATRVEVEPAPHDRHGGRATWHLRLEPGRSATVAVGVRVVDRDVADGDGHDDQGRDRLLSVPALEVDHPVRVRAATAGGAGRELTFESTDERLEEAVGQSLDDLAVLRIVDPAHADRVLIAAGAPWFMTLFGRDSILSAWMALPADPRLAAGVLRSLAEAQGVTEVPETEEQPGRILHEVRYDHRSVHLLEGANVYYGTVDATPLFVMLAVEHLRWTGDRDLARRLRPAIDRALTWIDTYGDRDGDGFVEYERQTATGLANQGWKDSWDGIRDHRGEVVEAPLALCEVQGYVYTAFGARAYLADLDGEHELARHWRRRASRLQEAFDRAFWVEELGTYAVALDGDKRPVASTTSNVGHCLWTGIVPAHRAGRVADALVSPSMFSGWGIRTLGADNPAFNPLSYHCGSVWPHDTALAVSGLHRYGFHRAAGQVRSGLLDAARAFDGRLPELFAGFGRSELPSPVSYPASCSPQAWAAASPLLLIRAILGLEPDLPGGTVGVRRSLPQGAGALRIGGVALGGVEASITADDRGVSVDGLAGTAAIRWMTDR